ncbi:hypothetical protein RRG08_012601 [Elysia crispata]|uniref:Uncharacterized protein n=1 Tax=Elysia crispata TaxID=231223 RepID=A0AAE1B039_9GAST|nr:hypothetical protein RRG08_012601 [Elysia crispata]
MTGRDLFRPAAAGYRLQFHPLIPPLLWPPINRRELLLVLAGCILDSQGAHSVLTTHAQWHTGVQVPVADVSDELGGDSRTSHLLVTVVNQQTSIVCFQTTDYRHPPGPDVGMASVHFQLLAHRLVVMRKLDKSDIQCSKRSARQQKPLTDDWETDPVFESAGNWCCKVRSRFFILSVT